MTQQTLGINDTVKVLGIWKIVGSTEGKWQIQLGDDASSAHFVKEENIELFAKAPDSTADPAITPKRSITDVGY